MSTASGAAAAAGKQNPKQLLADIVYSECGCKISVCERAGLLVIALNRTLILAFTNANGHVSTT